MQCNVMQHCSCKMGVGWCLQPGRGGTHDVKTEGSMFHRLVWNPGPFSDMMALGRDNSDRSLMASVTPEVETLQCKLQIETAG